MSFYGKGVINNDTELTIVLMTQIEGAVYNVVERLYDKLKLVIQDVIYSYPESEWYDRTMEFEKQWKVHATGVKGKTTKTILEHVPEMLSSNYINYQHSQWGGYIGEVFANTIFEGYEVFNTGVFVPPRPAWEIWLSRYASYPQVSQMFRGEMRKRGLPLE